MCPTQCWEDLGGPNGPYLPGVPSPVKVRCGSVCYLGLVWLDQCCTPGRTSQRRECAALLGAGVVREGRLLQKIKV